MIPILFLMILVPFLAVIPVLILEKKHSYIVAFIASLLVFLISAYCLYYSYTNGPPALSFTNFYIPALNINFSLVLTQPALILTVMTAIVFLAASMIGKYFIKDEGKLYNIIFLIALGSSVGVFMASNLFIFYVFWELAEVMMFFIIFIYGGYNRRYSAIKFLIYSVFSSLLLLIAILLIYNATTPHTFDIATIVQYSSSISPHTQLLIMVLLLLSFMIKMPVFPLHSWLPDAHTEAPTPGSMILAGVLLKFGGYGLYLMFLILPIATTYAHYIFIIFLFSAIYSAYVCMSQTNIKRLIAYTSITDMAIVGVGISAANVLGYNGGLYMMLSHGIAISLLFLIAGTLDEVYSTLEISKIRGVIKNFAGLSYLFIIGVFATLGIPLTIGFIADITLFIGAITAFGVLGVAPLLGILIMGATLFWVIERVFMNTSKAVEPYNSVSNYVMGAGIFLICAAVFFGIFPFLFI